MEEPMVLKGITRLMHEAMLACEDQEYETASIERHLDSLPWWAWKRHIRARREWSTSLDKQQRLLAEFDRWHQKYKMLREFF